MAFRISERIDAITLVTKDRYVAAPPAPKSVKIELTGRCNYRCGFCALRTRKVQPKGDMSLALFQRITGEMRAAGVEDVARDRETVAAAHVGVAFNQAARQAQGLLAQVVGGAGVVFEHAHHVARLQHGADAVANGLAPVGDDHVQRQPQAVRHVFKQAAQALGLPWPERPIPSKYTRKGREVHRNITDLARVRMQMLDES